VVSALVERFVQLKLNAKHKTVEHNTAIVVVVVVIVVVILNSILYFERADSTATKGNYRVSTSVEHRDKI
jgi:hypothetical protein